jgi:hypothetical protein
MNNVVSINNFVKELDLPIPSSGCGDIKITADSCDLTVEFEYYSKEKKDLIGVLRFSDLNAFRFSDERHIVDYSSGSYDTVLRNENSEWIQQLLQVEPKGTNGVEGKKHYAVFFSSNGYLEVIAASCSLDENVREGLLEEVS